MEKPYSFKNRPLRAGFRALALVSCASVTIAGTLSGGVLLRVVFDGWYHYDSFHALLCVLRQESTHQETPAPRGRVFLCTESVPEIMGANPRGLLEGHQAPVQESLTQLQAHQ